MRYTGDELAVLLGGPLDREGGNRRSGRLSARIAALVREAIRAAVLPAGTVMPPTRAVAAALAVSRGVAVASYEQLLAEGYLVARQGSGTRVADMLDERSAPAPAAPPPPKARPGVPDLGGFPRARWLAAYRHAVQTMSNADLGYGDPRGHARLRIELAGHLRRTRSADADPDLTVVTSGVADGLTSLVHVLGITGRRRIVLEDPTSPGTRALVAGGGLEVVGVPVDGEGLRSADVPQPQQVGAILLTPAHQYPTGSVLSAQRRRALIDLARRHDILLIEDDYDGAFRYRREPVGCLQGLAPDVTALLGSVSKTLAPALRLGWALLPRRWHASLLTQRVTGNQTGAVLDQLAFEHMLSSGSYDNHVQRSRRAYHARRTQLVDELGAAVPTARVRGDESGLHILVDLPPEAHEGDTVRMLRGDGFDVQGLAECTIGAPPAPRAGLVVGFAALQPTAITRLVGLLARTPDREFTRALRS